MTKLSRIISSDSGLTFIELIIGASLLSIVIAGAFSVQYLTNQQYRESSALIESRSSASRALSIISDDVREARKLSETEPAVVLGDRNELTIYANIDSDVDLEKVRYLVGNGALQRGVSQPVLGSPGIFGAETVRTISESVVNDNSRSLFRYFGDKDTELTSLPLSSADRAKVRIIRIGIVVIKRYGGSIVIEEDVFLRNTRPL